MVITSTDGGSRHESETSELSNSADSKKETSGTEPSVVIADSAENSAQLVEKVVEEEKNPDLCNGSENPVSVTDESGSTEASGTEKEPTKKLSAAAPPYTPSTIPIFGSLPLPGYTEHGGILPPPVNIAPMLPVTPGRRSPHQSASARVPYGPRLSGAYNRTGTRLPRIRPGFQENNGDQGPPRIMNPHATEFVPGQWVPSGYQVTPNGYIATPNGLTFSGDGYPISPNGTEIPLNGFPPLPNGITETQNGIPVSSEGSIEAPSDPTAEVSTEAPDVAIEEESVNESSSNSTVIHSETSEKIQEQVNEETRSDQSEDNGGMCTDAGAESAIPEGNGNDIAVEVKTTKCWGDYSDGEAEVIEAT